jgi:hypothetical protein
MKRALQRTATSAFLFFAAVALCAADKRVHLLPTLQPGQTFTYLIRFKSDKAVKTESRVAAPMAPNAAQIDAHGLLRIEILDVQQPPASKSTIRARAQFLTLDSGVWLKSSGEKNPNWDQQRIHPPEKAIEFTISPDGSITNTKNLDALLPDQQQAWQQWVARFALAWTFPPNGMKSGEKFTSEQFESSASPIAALSWDRESQYVRDEPCQPSQLSLMGDISASAGASPDTCAVFLTTAKLKQSSSPKDTTPEDFRLHDLRTRGTAKGTNEIITYISLKTGLVVRASEDSSQFMDVIIAEADGSNSVHYNVNATSHSEVLLVADTPLAHP